MLAIFFTYQQIMATVLFDGFRSKLPKYVKFDLFFSYDIRISNIHLNRYKVIFIKYREHLFH